MDTRSILVLTMIEKTITYPPLETFTKQEILKVDENVQKLVRDLKRDKQYLFSVRISKIWKKREQLLQLAENWHKIDKDYLDEIEDHQEIKWLRDERRKLTKKQREKQVKKIDDTKSLRLYWSDSGFTGKQRLERAVIHRCQVEFLLLQ